VGYRAEHERHGRTSNSGGHCPSDAANRTHGGAAVVEMVPGQEAIDQHHWSNRNGKCDWHATKHLVYYRVMSVTTARDRILAAAERAFADHPSLTMAELAAATGVSLRQLYRHFASREALLRELDFESPPGARERILEEALKLLGRVSLAELSMDELAANADVSRATLYRVVPGKSALFRELIATYSPWESIARVLDECLESPDTSPRQVIPRVAHALADALSGRTGVLLRMVLEMSRGSPDTAEGVQRSMLRGLPDLTQYLSQQMAAGQLRPLHPVIALQLLGGPLVAHELTRPLALLVGFQSPREAVVDQVVEFWLRAMAPERSDSDAKPG
jgi:AcrR family transcriptional regulator